MRISVVLVREYVSFLNGGHMGNESRYLSISRTHLASVNFANRSSDGQTSGQVSGDDQIYSQSAGSLSKPLHNVDGIGVCGG